MRSEVGARNFLIASALGKSMLMHMPEDVWPAMYENAAGADSDDPEHPPLRPFDEIADEVRAARARGWALDIEENEYGVCCVAAPVFDHGGRPVAAISVASAASYMPLERTDEIGPQVRAVADGLSRTLGWDGEAGENPALNDNNPARLRTQRRKQ